MREVLAALHILIYSHIRLHIPLHEYDERLRSPQSLLPCIW